MIDSLRAKQETGQFQSNSDPIGSARSSVVVKHFNSGAAAGPKIVDTRDFRSSEPAKNSSNSTRNKAREDTIAGCEALAALDLDRAAQTDTENGRRKFQLSAASWQARAELLGRLGVSAEKRRIQDRAEWQEADAVERQFPSNDQDLSYGPR